MSWNFLVFQAFLKALKFFFTDALNSRKNFVRTALKFYCFYVFSKALNFFNGCAEYALKPCMKRAKKWWNLKCKNCTQNGLKLCKKCAQYGLKFWIAGAFQRIQRFFKLISAHSAFFLQKSTLKRRWHFDPGTKRLDEESQCYNIQWQINFCWNFAYFL